MALHKPTQTSGLILSATGAISAGLGLAVAIGWHTGSMRLIRIASPMTPMIYNTAIGFVCIGAALLALAIGMRRLASIAALFTAALGLLALLQDLLATNFRIDNLLVHHWVVSGDAAPEHMCTTGAICFVLAGAAALLIAAPGEPRFRPFVVGALSAVVAAIGAGVFSFYLVGLFASYGAAPMAFHSACGFSILGSGLAASQIFEQRAHGRTRASLAPLLVAAGILSATLCGWFMLKALHDADLKTALRTAAGRVERELASSIESPVAALARMARQWNIHGALSRSEWESEAPLYLEDYPAFDTIACADAGRQVRWVVNTRQEEPHVFDPAHRERLNEAFERAAASGRMVLGRGADLPNGAKSILAVVPTVSGGRQDGFIMAVLRIPALIEPAVTAAVAQRQSCAIAVFDETGKIYARNEEAVAGDPATQVFTLESHGMVWRVRFLPQLLVGRFRTALPSMALAMGIVTAVLVSLLLYVAQAARLRARRLEAANRELEREVAERNQAQAALARARDELEIRVRERTAELARANEVLTAEIAERKKAEETLRASEERYRELLDSANDLVYTHDLRGNLISVNKAAEKTIGYPREEALRMNIAQIVVPEHLELVQQMMARKLGGEPSTIYEVCVRTADGRKVILEVNTHLLYRNGNPAGVHGIAREVSERKRLEEQLRQSQKMEAIGRLAGGVAHDFNNLLTVIGAYSHMLLEGLENDESLQGYAQEILWASERASALTNRLLSFSRRQVVHPRVIDLNALIENMTNLLNRLIGEDIELVTELGPGLGRIKADPSQIEQVIMNLAVNSRDAMPSGGRLTLATANVEIGEQNTQEGSVLSPGSYVQLVVTDTGEGMDAETRGHVFEPFFTTKAPNKGTGLGLSTVYGIVKLSEGEITVESEPGKGSAFRIYLPRVEPEPGEDARPANERKPGGGDETILLVEDEIGVRKLVRQMLVQLGYTVIEAANGQEGLEICQRDGADIDLLLTDVVMPGMSGRELAGRLAPLHPEMKVLYMTGYTQDDIIHRGVLQQEFAVLQKPFLAEALAAKVREVLDGIED